jgi:hypothetical protein
MNRWQTHATLEDLFFPELWFQISAISARFSHFFCCIQAGRHALLSKRTLGEDPDEIAAADEP